MEFDDQSSEVSTAAFVTIPSRWFWLSTTAIGKSAAAAIGIKSAICVSRDVVSVS